MLRRKFLSFLTLAPLAAAAARFLPSPAAKIPLSDDLVKPGEFVSYHFNYVVLPPPPRSPFRKYTERIDMSPQPATLGE
jgi:hypothetical protein